MARTLDEKPDFGGALSVEMKTAVAFPLFEECVPSSKSTPPSRGI
jgi:hypothetical protein